MPTRCSGVDGREPSWSPDGTHLLFTTQTPNNANVATMTLHGTDIHLLTTDPGSDTAADWSPDGSRIVFSSNRVAGRFRLYTMAPDGSAQTLLVDNAAGQEWTNPVWSPDGGQITFQGTGPDPSGLLVMAAGGTGVTKLTGDGFAPTWVPDVPRPDAGYLLAGRDGAVDAFGAACQRGSMAGTSLPHAPWSGWCRRPRVAATGWWRRTAGCSPSATPPSTDRWVGAR